LSHQLLLLLLLLLSTLLLENGTPCQAHVRERSRALMTRERIIVQQPTTKMTKMKITTMVQTEWQAGRSNNRLPLHTRGAQQT
jgi:hypothetical protein